MKTKLDRRNYMFDTRKGEVLIKTPGQIDGKDFVVMKCEDCTIFVCDHTSQVFVDDSINCKIYFGPCSGSLFIRDCKGLEISCAASQFRVSNSSDIKACVYTSSDPALEKATDIHLAPYNFSYPQIDEHFAKAALNVDLNRWSEVFDFTPNPTQRNWAITPPQAYPGPFVKEIEGFPQPPENPVPVPVAYGGSSTKPIVVGSSDARCSEKGGEVVDFGALMGKSNVHKHMEAVDVWDEEELQVELQSPENQQSQRDEQGDWKAAPAAAVNYLKVNEKSYRNEQDIRQKEDLERQEKLSRQAKAREWLAQWKRYLIRQNLKKKNKNRDQVTAKDEKHPKSWQVVAQNVSLKEGDHLSTRPVDKMRQAIINKRNDGF